MTELPKRELGRTGLEVTIPLEIVMALGSSIIRNSVSAIGNYLTKAAQSTSSPLLTAIGYTDLFRAGSGSGGNLKIESNLECLVIVSGNFGELGAVGFSVDYAKAADPDQIFVKVTNGQADTSRLRDLNLVDLPTSYFEFRFDRHPVSEAFRLVPTLAYFRVSNAARNQQGPKNIEITVTISKPSPTGALDIQKVTGDSGLVAQVPIVLNQVIPGRIRKLGGLDFQTVWITSPKTIEQASRFVPVERIYPCTNCGTRLRGTRRSLGWQRPHHRKNRDASRCPGSVATTGASTTRQPHQR
jgi:hypothetical protein